MAAVDTKTDKPSLRRRMRLTLAVLAVLIPGAAVVILFLAFSRKPSPD